MPYAVFADTGYTLSRFIGAHQHFRCDDDTLERLSDSRCVRSLVSAAALETAT